MVFIKFYVLPIYKYTESILKCIYILIVVVKLYSFVYCIQFQSPIILLPFFFHNTLYSTFLILFKYPYFIYDKINMQLSVIFISFLLTWFSLVISFFKQYCIHVTQLILIQLLYVCTSFCLSASHSPCMCTCICICEENMYIYTFIYTHICLNVYV